MNTQTKDKYDEAIEYLRNLRNPDDFSFAIFEAWNNPQKEKGGCLFSFVSPSGDLEKCPIDANNRFCGCLTQIRGSMQKFAYTKELTKAIRNDSRIPQCIEEVTLEHLEVFAEWQRKIDKELGRE